MLVAAGAATAAPTPAPTTVRVSGSVVDKQGASLVDPTCLYFWPKDTQDPDGWRMSFDCVDLSDTGAFSTVLPVGDYKVQVEASNVVEGMFIGGADLAKAKTLSVPAKGLVGQLLKVDTMTKVSGRVTGINSQALANPNCVYFWNQDKAAPRGWSRPDQCADLDFTGAFTAWVPAGSHKVEVQADNVAAETFAGRDGTLLNGTVVKVASKPIVRLALTVPVQPPMSGNFVIPGLSGMPRPASLTVWVPDSATASGWRATTDTWWVDSTGAFTVYLDPGRYRLQLNYGKPSKSAFFGGPTIDTARTVVMPAGSISGLNMRIGSFPPPQAPSGAMVSTFDAAMQVAWTPAPAPSVVTYSVATAQPGGAFCATAGASCTITGLKNGTDYTVTLTTVNEGGEVSLDLGTWRPAVPAPVVSVDPLILPGGGTVTLKMSSLPGNLPVTVSGKPGVTAQKLVTSANGSLQASFALRSAGKVTFSIKGKKVALTTFAYVPVAKFPASVKVNKATAFSVTGLPPRIVMQYTVGSTKTVVTTDAKGVGATTLTFPRAGQYTVTATVNSTVVGSAVVTVS